MVWDAGAVFNVKHENGYLVSLSYLYGYEISCIFGLTVRYMSNPQNISAGTRVTLNQFCFGMDFNEKYIVVPMGEERGLYNYPIHEIVLFSLNTLEVIRKIKVCSPFSLDQWHLRRNLIIWGSKDKKIRQLCYYIYFYY